MKSNSFQVTGVSRSFEQVFIISYNLYTNFIGVKKTESEISAILLLLDIRIKMIINNIVQIELFG